MEEEERLRVEEEEKRVREKEKKQELKAMIKEIQEEVQAKVTGQVVAMLHTFLGDVGMLLRYLLKGGNTDEQNNETTLRTMRALQALQTFDQGDFDSDSESESDSDISDSSEEGNETRRYRGRNPQQLNACKCGKAMSKYQRGRYG